MAVAIGTGAALMLDPYSLEAPALFKSVDRSPGVSASLL